MWHTLMFLKAFLSNTNSCVALCCAFKPRGREKLEMHDRVLCPGMCWLRLRHPSTGSGQRQLSEIRYLKFTVVSVDRGESQMQRSFCNCQSIVFKEFFFLYGHYLILSYLFLNSFKDSGSALSVGGFLKAISPCFLYLSERLLSHTLIGQFQTPLSASTEAI